MEIRQTLIYGRFCKQKTTAILALFEQVGSELCPEIDQYFTKFIKE